MSDCKNAVLSDVKRSLRYECYLQHTYILALSFPIGNFKQELKSLEEV